MTEQELLDIFIQERINMLIDIFHKNQPNKSKKEDEQILQAEIFIETLPDKEKELVDNYIGSLIKHLALEEAFLYQHGIIDGMKILKYINKFITRGPSFLALVPGILTSRTHFIIVLPPKVIPN